MFTGVVLGIDPGPTNTGFAFVERVSQKRWKVLDSGCATAHVEVLETTGEKHRVLNAILEDLIAKWSPSRLGIERVFFGRNKTSCLDTAEVIGCISLLGARCGLREFRLTPQEIKAVAGSVRASKKDLARAVERLCCLEEGARSHHENDAIAIAIAASMLPDHARV